MISHVPLSFSYCCNISALSQAVIFIFQNPFICHHAFSLKEAYSSLAVYMFVNTVAFVGCLVMKKPKWIYEAFSVLDFLLFAGSTA